MAVPSSQAGEDASPARSRRGLFQSLSSSNLAGGGSGVHQTASSLPPHAPRSFYLGELDLVAGLRGSRSHHASPAQPPASLQQRFQPARPADSGGRGYRSLGVAGADHHCPVTPHTTDCESGSSELGCPLPGSGPRVPPTAELADTARPPQQPRRQVRLRRHRSSHALDLADGCEAALQLGNRHSVHFDTARHAQSGLETLDFPPRKKTWPPDGPRCEERQGLQRKHRGREKVAIKQITALYFRWLEP